MTTPPSLLVDALGRVHEDLPGLHDDANPVGWLVWHLTRVQDDHLAELGGVEQACVAQGFAERFGAPYDVADVGYGQSSEQVGALRPSVVNDITQHLGQAAYVRGLLDRR